MGLSEKDLKERTHEKERAISRIETALTLIGGHNREPNHWERVCLTEAIACVFAGIYEAATGVATNAMSQDPLPDNKLPSQDIYYLTFAALKEACEKAKRAPIEPYPRLGTI